MLFHKVLPSGREISVVEHVVQGILQVGIIFVRPLRHCIPSLPEEYVVSTHQRVVNEWSLLECI